MTQKVEYMNFAVEVKYVVKHAVARMVKLHLVALVVSSCICEPGCDL